MYTMLPHLLAYMTLSLLLMECKVGRSEGDQPAADSTDSRTPPQIGQDANVHLVAEHQ